MRLLKTFLAIMAVGALSSCGGSGNTGGLYWIPTVLLLASIFCGIRLYKSYQSGGQRLINSPGSPDDGKWVDTGTKVLSKGLVFFTLVFLILAVVIYFMIKSDYRPAKPSDQQKWEKQKAKGTASIVSQGDATT